MLAAYVSQNKVTANICRCKTTPPTTSPCGFSARNTVSWVEVGARPCAVAGGAATAAGSNETPHFPDVAILENLFSLEDLQTQAVLEAVLGCSKAMPRTWPFQGFRGLSV